MPLLPAARRSCPVTARGSRCLFCLAAAVLLTAPALAFAGSADALITMTVAPNPVIAGATVTYSITASNNGPDPSTNVVVTDTLPTSLTFVSATPSQGTCTGTTTVTCSFGSLPLYGSATVDIVAKTTGAGTVSNTASVAGAEPDPDLTNNSVTKSITANVGADLSIGISGTPSTVVAGASLTYTITSGNNGPSPATSVTITGNVPAGTTYTSGSGTGWTCTVSSGVVTCNRASSTPIGSLPNLVLVFKVTQVTGTVSDSFAISAVEGDPDSSNNTANVSNTVISGADVQMAEPTPSSPVATGNPINYTLTVKNNGPGAASGITVTDTLSPNVTFGSVTGSGWSCSQSGSLVTCTQPGPVASGVTLSTITINTTATTAGSTANTSNVSTTTTDPTPSNNNGSATVTIQAPGADMSITQSASPNPVATGANLTYTITGKNNGPLATTGTISITDVLPSNLTYVSASGTGWTCSNASGTVTCTTPGPLASGATSNAVNLVAIVNAAGTISNLPCVAAASPTDPVSSNNCITSSSVTSTSLQADLVVTQDAPSPNPVVAGSVLTYTVHVANNGPNDAGGVTLLDTLGNTSSIVATPSTGTCSGNPNLSCNLGPIVSGGNATVTIQIKPTTAGSHTNTASASSGTVGDPNTANNSATVTSNVNAGADMALTQTANPQPVLAGTNLTYVATARNNGPLTATGVVVTENLPPGVTYVSAGPSSGTCSQAGGVVTCNLGSLASASQGTVTIIVTPTTPGSITATGSVTSSVTDPDTTNNAVSTTSTVNPAQVDVQVTKYGTPNPVAYGGTVTYTITVHNSGPSIATGVVATDTPMTQFTFVSITPSQGSCSGTTTITCTLGTIANGASATMTMVMTATSIGTFNNQVTVTSNETDSNTANNTANEQTTSRQGADLSVTKAASPPSVFLNGTASYTMVVSNAGPVSSVTATLTDVLPAGVTYLSSSASQGSCSGVTTLTCNLGTLASGAGAIVTLNVTAMAVGTIVNTVNVSGSEPDPNSANNTASANLTVNPIADMTVTKSHTGNFTVGQTGAAYSLAVTNSGGAATTAPVSVADTLPTGLTPTAATGTGWSCSIAGQVVSCNRSDVLAANTSYAVIAVTVNVAANAPASVTNTVTVSGGGENLTNNNSASDPTTIVQEPDLTITKTHAGTFSQGQSGATFTINVNNIGLAATAGTVTVTDTVPTGLAPVSAAGSGWTCSLAGQTETCTRPDALAPGSAYSPVTVTVNVPAGTTGSVTNTATVSLPGEVITTNNSASDTVTISGSPDLTIAKTHSGAFSQGQQNATYTLTVSNVGGAMSTGVVSVTDTLPTGLTAAAASGSGWSCTLLSGTPTCTRNDALASGASYSAISVSVAVASNAASNVTNTASVAGGGESNFPNDTATDPTEITPAADLTILLTNSGNVTEGGSATYSIAVSNIGGNNTSGTVTVIDSFPAGVILPSSLTTAGWSCAVSGQTLTCNRPDSLASGASYPIINVPVTLNVNAAPTLSDTATVAGGSEVNLLNDSSTSLLSVTPIPDLTLALSHNGTFSQGASGSYTITPRNIGGAASSGSVTISDPLPGGLVFTGASGVNWTCNLPPSTVVSCTSSTPIGPAANGSPIIVNVSVDPAAPASISDTATISGGGETNISNDTATDVTPVTGVPDLTLSMTNSGGFVQGGPGTFTLSAKNIGAGASSAAVTVSDTFPQGVTPDTGAAHGTGWTCTVVAQSVTCTSSDILSAGTSYSAITVPVHLTNNASVSFSNSANVSGGGETNVSNDTATNNVTGVPGPDLAISMTVTSGVVQGQPATYTINNQNVGGSPTYGLVTVTDTFPAGVMPRTATGPGTVPWSCTVVGQIVTCTRSDALAPGGTYPPITVTVNISNTASLSISDMATVAGGGDINPANNTATVVTTVTSAPDMTLSISNSGNFAQGGTGTYTIVANNIGGTPTSGPVSFTDTIPSGATAATPTVATGWTCTVSGQLVTCNRPDTLAGGSSYPPVTIPVTLALNAPASLTDNGVVSGGSELNISNDSATNVVAVAGMPDLALAKTHTGGFTVASPAVYSLNVSNVGSAATTAPVTVTDTLPAGLTAASATGVGWTCSIATQTVACTRSDSLAPGASFSAVTITVSLAAGTSGTITNTAAVAGGGERNLANDRAQDIATVAQAADLTITKQHTGVLLRGGTVSYSILVSNISASATDGTPVTVVDTLPTGLKPISAQGTSWLCNIAEQVVTCTRRDILAGQTSYPAITLTSSIGSTTQASITNVATVTGGGDLTTGNNQAQDSAAIIGKSDLSLTATQSPIFRKGASASYFLKVSNVGQTATDGTLVTVTDTLPPGLTPVNASGVNWTCGVSAQTVTCTRIDALAASASYPTITLIVNVLLGGASMVTNNALVNGGGDTNLQNNTATLPSAVQPAFYPDLTITKSHNGDFTQGLTGQYSIQISNAGAAPTNGPVYVSDTLPNGLSATRVSGTGWSCSIDSSTVDCSRSDLLAVAAQYPPISISVKVAADAPVALQNVASVRGGGETNDTNDRAADPTRIIIPPLPQLAIAETADRSTVEIGDALTYTLQLSDTSAVSAENSVVDSRLPVGFTYVPGTARMQVGAASVQALEPKTNGADLIFQIGHFPPHGLIVITFRVRIGANIRPGTYLDISSLSGYAPTGQHVGPVSAQASVRAGANSFTSQRALVGRVYIDTNNNGVFDKGDEPLPGARIFLSDGQAAVTDSQGLFSLPTIPQGSVVVSIDPITLPAGYIVSSVGERQGESLTRLLRTPLGGGTVVRQNFALRAMPGAKPLSPSQPAPENTASKTQIDKAKIDNQPADPITPVAPGDISLLKPAANEIITASNPAIAMRVSENWSIAVTLNDHRLDTAKLTPSVDHAAHTATFTIADAKLTPGPNTLRVWAVGPTGQPGKPVEISFHRSGPPKRLEISPAKPEVTAGGSDFTRVRVRGYDAWGKLAADTAVNLATSRGQFDAVGGQPAKPHLTEPLPENTTPLDFRSIGAGASAAGGSNFLSPSALGVTGSTMARTSMSQAIDSVGSTASATSPAGTNSSGVSSWAMLAAGSAASAASTVNIAEEHTTQEVISLHGGEAVAQLRSPRDSGSAEVTASLDDAAGMHTAEGRAYVAFVPELRSPILVGMGELSFGRSAPEIALFNEAGSVERRAQFFYTGRLLHSNLLTMAYSSQSPLNRTSGYDQMFNMDATNQQYVVFGDSSARFYNAQSNSRLYARIDHGLSYLMFGDLSGGLNQPRMTTSLTSFDRSVTGLKLHLEDHGGNSVSITGARPDTAYARDVFPGNSLGLIALSHQAVLPGSEVITLETRDRRNPGVIVTRETLIRSTDYTMDNYSGSIFFLRSISALDSALNLTQIIISYEYQAVGLSSSVYTARAEKRFDPIGLRLGLSFLNDRQGGVGSYLLAGIEGSKKLPHGGFLTFESPLSHGTIANSGTAFTDTGTGPHNGAAVRAELEQPINALSGILRASLSKTDANFLNPFGSTIVPGAQTIAASYEFKPLSSAHLRLGFADERNKTVTVNNHRYTFSGAWKQQVTERVDLTLGYDLRDYNDNLLHRIIDSNLLTFGADWRITNKLQASARREQNIGAADPTYPSQTVLSAKYQISPATKLFYTQRISSAPIIPIGDLSAAGFASINSTSEMSLGIETRLRQTTSLESRYEIDNGINGTDSYAVIGLVDRLPVNATTSIDFGAERGLHIDGKGHDFNSGTTAISWRPTKFFRATSRYELRDQYGFASLITGGAAGRIRSGVTALGQLQFVRGTVNGQNNSLHRAIAALAIRPLKSDRAGLLFSYNEQSGRGYTLQPAFSSIATAAEPVRVNILSSDAWWQPLRHLEFYSRFADSYRTQSAAGQADLSTQTFMWQQRAQYRFARYFDTAGEARWLWQPITNSDQRTAAVEIGGWLLPDIRLGLGYNFTSVSEYAPSFLGNPIRQGFYFNITGKFSRLFDLFGTAPESAAAVQGHTAEKH